MMYFELFLQLTASSHIPGYMLAHKGVQPGGCALTADSQNPPHWTLQRAELTEHTPGAL
jgi:hypothetical protein